MSRDLLFLVVVVCLLGTLVVTVRVLRSKTRLAVAALLVCAGIVSVLWRTGVEHEIAAHRDARDRLCDDAQTELESLARYLRDDGMIEFDQKVDMGTSARSWARSSLLFCLGADASARCGTLLLQAQYAPARTTAAEYIEIVADAFRTRGTCTSQRADIGPATDPPRP